MASATEMTILKGTVSDEITRKPLAGVKVGIADTNIITVTASNGSFKLKSSTGRLRITVRVKDRIVRSNVVRIRSAKSSCRVTVNMVEERVNVTLLSKPAEFSWNEPVVLLPLSLQIRKITKDTPLRHTDFAIERVDSRGTPSGLLQPFHQTLKIDDINIDHDEYWIRWYPDEIHHLTPVGRITEEEKAAWREFYFVFEKLREGRDQFEALRAFIDSLTNPSEWDRMGSIEFDDAAARQQMLDWLEIFYGFKPGALGVMQTNFCKQYDSFIVPAINAGTIAFREAFGWKDMENVELKTAWVNLVSKVGVDRARQISKSTEEGADWDFDTIYPLHAEVGYAEQLSAGEFPNGLKNLIEQGSGMNFSDDVVVVTQDGVGWLIEDRESGYQFSLTEREGGIDIFNVKGEEEDPLELIMDQGSRLLSLPAEASLYTIRDQIIKPLVENIRIEREKLLLAPTELKGTHWTVDFAQALKNGMGIKISEQSKVHQIDNADWLIMTGINKSADSHEILEEILRRNHAKGELAILAQDSPTNNTEQGKTAQEELTAVAEDILRRTRMRLKDELPGSYLFPRADAIKLNKLFKLDPSTLSEVRGAELTEQKEALAMGTLIWESLSPVINVYIDKLAPLIGYDEKNDSYRVALRTFFLNHVKGRGTLPIIKVGNNPYGILPVLPFGKHASSSLLAKDQEINNRLTELLVLLKNIFLGISETTVPRIDDASPTAYEDLLEVLRQTAVSQKLYCNEMPGTKGIDFWNFDFSSSPVKVNCQSVKEPTLPSSAPESPDTYAFHTDTQYLDLLYNYDRSLGKPIPVDRKSSVLRRIIAYTIQNLINTSRADAAIKEMKVAADVLRRMDPEKLEILFMETLDLFSFRLDAWFSAIADAQLSRVLEASDQPPPIGIYGWLEQPGRFADTVHPTEYIYCPSDQHATTAAIMHSASETTNPAVEKEAFQFELPSGNIRKAEEFLDRIRAGYPSEELLGKKLEELIKAAAKVPGAEITPADVYTQRELFPLTIDQSTYADAGNTASLGVSTVIDGEKFIAHNTDSKFQKVRQDLSKVKDSVAGVSVGELLFQQGNQDRQAAWMDFLDGKSIPPETEFTGIRRTGRSVNTTVYFTIDEATLPTSGSTNPRRMAEPRFAAFCDSVISFSGIEAKLKIIRDASHEVEHTITMSAWSFEAVDLVVGGEKEMLIRARYHVMDEWQKTSGVATSPFDGLGQFPGYSSEGDLLSELEIRLEPDTSPASIHPLIEKASRMNRLFSVSEKELTANINPMEVPLPLNRVPEDLDADATVTVLKNRLLAIRKLYKDALLPSVDLVANFMQTLSSKAALLKIRGVLGRLKDDVLTTDEKNLMAAHAMLTWRRIEISNEYLSGGMASNEMQQLETIISSPAEESAARIQRLIDSLFTIEMEIDSIFHEETTGAITDSAALFNQLRNIGIHKAQLLHPPRSAEEVPPLVELLKGIVTAAIEKFDPFLVNQHSLSEYVTRLKISLFQWEEITTVLDVLDSSATGWEEQASTKLVHQVKLSMTDATNLVDGWMTSGGLYRTFIANQTAAIDALDEAALDYPAEWTAEEKIFFAIGSVKTAADLGAMPVLRPYPLKVAGSAAGMWDINFPEKQVINTDPRVAAYKNVRSRFADLLELFPDRSVYKIFEGEVALAPGTTEEGAPNENAVQFYFGKAQNSRVASPLLFRIDTWTELIPNAYEHTAIALQYESPKNESPNAILVAVPPKIDHAVKWTDLHLAEAVSEVIDLMQVRMVSSEHVKQHPILGNYLPATIYRSPEAFVPTVSRFSILGLRDAYYFQRSNTLTQSQLDAINQGYTSTSSLPNSD